MNFHQILSFLEELAQNNNKAWMDEHKKVYQAARNEFIDINKYIINQLAEFDPGLAGLDPKKSIFRINRDIRFSNNKDPYKINFGAFLMEGGKKSGNAGYYLHLQPGDESFIAGGAYMPESAKLAMVRQEIDYNGSELFKITQQKEFKALFGAIQGDTLKKTPKGYPVDHPNIELLKMKSFLALHKVTDAEVTKNGFEDYVVDVFKALVPFNDFFNVAMSQANE